MKRNKILRTIVIVIVIVVAIYLLYGYRKQKNRPEWRTDVPSMGNVREVVTATGSLNPHVLVNVGTEVSGRIEKIYKDFNSLVKKGDLLAKLDTELLETSIESAKSELNKAKINVDEAKLDLELLKELYKKDMAAEYEVRKAEFKHTLALQSLHNSQLALQRAQKNLDNAYISSPIDGVIVSRNVDEGQTVAASLNAPTLFVIANNLEQMQITASVDEADIGKISLNLPVEFTVDAYSGERFRGKINQIRLNPNTDQNVVSYNIIIDAQNPERKLLPGMTANVTIVIQNKTNVLRIPESATRFNPNKELWQLFGLKWDDEYATSMVRRRDSSAMAAPTDSTKKAIEGTGTRKPSKEQGSGETASVKGGKQRTRDASDSLRTGTAHRQKPESTAGTGDTFQLATGSQVRRSMRMASVWVLENGVPQRKMVRVGLSDGAFVEVLEGIEDNDQLITGVIYKSSKQAANSNSVMQNRPGMGRGF